MKKYVAKLVVFAAILVSLAAQANCGPKEVKLANQQWADAINSNDTATVVKLYANDAILLPTYGNDPITTTAGRTAYFNDFFAKHQNLRVHFDKTLVQLLSGGAVSSGLYTFTAMQQDKPSQITARYTFVYRTTATGCQLINQHSSVTPLPTF